MLIANSVLAILIGSCCLFSALSPTGSFSLAAQNDSSYGTTAQYQTPIKHVVIILMENTEYFDVIGSSSAPFENVLANNYSLATQYYAITHPSLPNYLALIGGSTFGVTTDCSLVQCLQNSTNLTDLLVQHDYSWKEYAESMQANCSRQPSLDGLYAPKHDPFVYFKDVTGNDGTGATSTYCDSHVVPFTRFTNDLQSNDLPNYAFITPNLCNDAHDCSLAYADNWLSTHVSQIIDSTSFSSTVIFIVYDEGSTNLGFSNFNGGHVACIAVSPFVKSHYRSIVQYSHYSLLATVESIFGVGSLGRGDSNSSNMQDLFNITLPPNQSTKSPSTVTTAPFYTNIKTESKLNTGLTGNSLNQYIVFAVITFLIATVILVTRFRREGLLQS
ncbi:MAG: alkaline phosphatase family protein [Nitrososphaerales archaeon]